MPGTRGLSVHGSVATAASLGVGREVWPRLDGVNKQPPNPSGLNTGVISLPDYMCSPSSGTLLLGFTYRPADRMSISTLVPQSPRQEISQIVSWLLQFPHGQTCVTPTLILLVKVVTWPSITSTVRANHVP